MVKLLFSVSTHGLVAARWQGRKLVDCGVYLNTPPGWAEFSQFLADYKGASAYLMVNAVEEDYRNEALPHTWGGTRKTLLTRKLSQIFRNTPYRSAVLQSQEAGQRREDIFLFSALNKPDILRPWIEGLSANQIPVAGVYLLPMVSETLVSELKLTNLNVLLVSEHSAGLRQSYFRQGKLKASRLSFADQRHKNNQGEYAAEIERTLLYLHSLKALNPDEALTLAVLDPSDILASVCQLFNDDSNVRCILMDSHYLNAHLKRAHPQAFASSDLLHLFLLSSRHNFVNLAPPIVTHTFGTYQARRAMYVLSALVLLVSGAWSAFNLYRYNQDEQRALQAAAASKLSATRYRQATLQFPSAPASATDLQAAVQVAQQLAANKSTPERAMQITSAALQNFPQIELQGLRWRSGPPESGLIEGEIKPFRGDYRAAIAAVTDFNLTLKAVPDVISAQVLEWPLNLSSTEGMRGSTQDEDQTGTIKAKFKLKIELKPTGEHKQKRN